MKVVTVQVTPPKAAAAAAAVIVTVARIQKATVSSRAKRERRARKKIPVGITAPRLSSKSRVKRPPLVGAGHRALAPDRSGLKRSPEITDKQGLRGDRAGVDTAAQKTRASWREVKRDGDATAGTGRGLAAPSPAWTGAGAAREAGRTEVKTGVTAETGRGTEAAQMGGRAERQTRGAGAGRGGRRKGAEGGVGAGRKERGARTEAEGSTDWFSSLSDNMGHTKNNLFYASLAVNVFIIVVLVNSLLCLKLQRLCVGLLFVQ